MLEPPRAVSGAPGRGIAGISLDARALLTRALPGVVVLALAGLLALVYQPGNIGYDSAYSLIWGKQLAHLQVPDFGGLGSPTPHPLSYGVGALASLTGSHAYTLLLALSFVSFALLGYTGFLAGRRAFGWIAGVVCAVIVLTRPLLVAEALQGSVDIPFMALALGALAVELREHRPRLVLWLLVPAGLLRPEAWLLSAAYAAWVFMEMPAAQWRRMVPLAALAPALWLGLDLLFTGDALFSLHHTQELAVSLQRPLGFDSALQALPDYLSIVLGGAVVWCSVASCVLVSWLLHERARLPVLMLLATTLGFLALGVFRLPILTRFVLLPSALMALFAGAALAAWQLLPARSGHRRLAAIGAAATASALAVSIPATIGGMSDALALAADRARTRDDLSTVVNVAQAGGWVKGCGPVQSPTYRFVPILAYWLGVRPNEIPVRYPADSRHGLVLTAPTRTLDNDAGFLPTSVLAVDSLALPAAFHPIAITSSWTLAEHCQPSHLP